MERDLGGRDFLRDVGALATERNRRVVDLRHAPAGQAALAALADLPPGGHYVWPQGWAVSQRPRQICAELGVAGKGMHGLRATFAERYLRRHLMAGQSEEAARDRLALLLGHTRQ